MATLKNTTINDTGYIKIPSGTISQRPSPAANGMIRYNSDLGVTEYYASNNWLNITTGKPPIVTSGLVLNLDAGDGLSYPGSGNIWFDISGSGNNGTLTNGPTYSSANNGCIVFDGSDDSVSLNSSSMNFSTQQTIFMFLKPEESDGNRRNPYAQAYGGYGTITHESDGGFSYYHGTNGGNGDPYQYTGSSFTVAQNEIACISVVRDSSYVKWYKNGVFSNQKINSYPTAVSSLNTITLASGYVSNFLGRIYCCLLYTRALSATEIQQNFQALRGRYGI